MSMYIASLSRLTMLFNLAVWSTAGKRGAAGPPVRTTPRNSWTSPRHLPALLLISSNLVIPQMGYETWAEFAKYGTSLDFKLIYLLANLAKAGFSLRRQGRIRWL